MAEVARLRTGQLHENCYRLNMACDSLTRTAVKLSYDGVPRTEFLSVVLAKS